MVRNFNGSTTNVNVSGMLGIFGLVYLVEHALMNVLSMKRLKHVGFVVRYDGGLDEFIVSKDQVSIKFMCNENGLYTWNYFGMNQVPNENENFVGSVESAGTVKVEHDDRKQLELLKEIHSVYGNVENNLKFEIVQESGLE